MKSDKNNSRQKKKNVTGPINVPSLLWIAKQKLTDAYFEDSDLEKFAIQLSNGCKITSEHIHMWINAAAQHYEEIGPRAQALRTLREKIDSQGKPVLQ
ncbi:MAG: hypothetical protein ACREFR_01450 [Limisphaerales bacterium]